MIQKTISFQEKFFETLSDEYTKFNEEHDLCITFSQFINSKLKKNS